MIYAGRAVPVGHTGGIREDEPPFGHGSALRTLT
jgi:hypothetical protein